MTSSKEFNCVLSDKVLMKHIEGKEYINCANEAETISICAGYFLATGKRGNAYMSGDGFMNALNFITSWIMPEKIEMNIYISTGRQEPPHKVVTGILPELLELLRYDFNKLKIELLQ